MTNAAATPDPVAAAVAIAQTARRKANAADDRNGTAAVAVLATGVIGSLFAIVAMLSSPATIPLWCATHGGCP
jgi:threonine dehydrogenase-like Zn-dependent dehydrogenase